MLRIFSGHNILEAHIIAGLLQSRGVDAHVSGHYLQGAVGELPATDFADVCIDESQEKAALDIIRRFEAGEFAPSAGDPPGHSGKS